MGVFYFMGVSVEAELALSSTLHALECCRLHISLHRDLMPWLKHKAAFWVQDPEISHS